MAFPVNNSGNPWGTGMQANAFMPFDPNMMNGMPGLFPPPVPLAMGMPGLFPDPSMGGFMGDPFMGAGMQIDPMTGLPLNAGFNGFTMPPVGAPPMGMDPFTGMPMLGFGDPSMMPPMAGMPPAGNLMMDPFGGMGMPGAGMGMGTPSMGMFGTPAQANTQPASNPIKDMFSNLMKMMMIKKLLNRNNEQAALEEASSSGEEAETEEVEGEGGEVADNATALDIIGDPANFKSIAGGDGNISLLDLSRAARKSKDADVKAAAEYIKSNLQLFKQLEKISKPGDGVFTEADLNKAMQTTSIIQGGDGNDTLHGGGGNDTLAGGEGEDDAEAITDDASALDAFANHFDELDENSDGKVKIGELSAVASESDDPTLKKLAKYLRTTGLFAEVDDLDDKEGVKAKDINDALKDPNIVEQDDDDAPAPIDVTGVTDEQAIKTINTNWAIIDGIKDPKKKDRALADGKLTVEDLDAVINTKDKKITEDMKKAAQVMKNNALIAKMDKSEKDDTATANVNESSDGSIAKDTLQKWTDDYETVSRQSDGPKDIHKAMQVINDNIGLFAEGEDKLVSYNDLMRALNSSDQKYKPEVKAALQYVKDHKDQFEQLDKADGADDDNLQVDVIADAALGEVGDYGFNDGAKSAEKNKEALNIVKDIFKDKLDTQAGDDDDDDKVGEEDFTSALADTSGKYTAKQKAAMKYVFEVQQSGTTLWEAMDGGDSIVSWEDLQHALTKNLDPENGDIGNDDLDAH
ncbi:MAG: hypothetical protein K0Q50_1265 [Vampirovibrio sp.]|jgi:hypothetical protein|nr:hypothetical protein [Vampirovibrio sp.]